MGRKIVLSPQQEKELSKRNIRLALTGYPITSKILRMCVFTYCEKNNIPNPFVKETEMAGSTWVEGFLRCNPITASRKAQNLNPGRAQKFKCFIVNDYFEKLKITMEELGIMNKPECIYNVNEKGYRSCLHKKPLVLRQKAENTLIWLLSNMGKMSPSCPVDMPLDQPYQQCYSLKDKE